MSLGCQQQLRLTARPLGAGVFNEPTSDLTKLLAKLVDSSNHILVPGWYDAVRHNTLTPALERLDALHPPEFTLANYRKTLGVPELRKEVRTHGLTTPSGCLCNQQCMVT